MLSVLISIPSLILIWLLVYECFITDDNDKKEFSELFMLDSPIVRIFYAVVVVSVIVWVLSFIFPLGAVVKTLDLVENFVAIMWLIKALFAGNVKIWIDIIKFKFTNKM
ncbi:hypothetical protein [Escherichia coli]|uniref:Uncharacterized protein n=3 Tax=Asteriusvirus PBECO4 TaxID=2560463 RepID=A0A1C3S663_9CAUD|nr:hypothetical protein ACQ29_gp337 [Escherichia phage PBECO4]AXC36594.1 hypothetical protein [Escherichia phage UB]EFF2105742.1 hypothetical protein [Escherichia coli]QDF13679.1 hypothetical protein vBEcoMphAPEC6_gp049c [Escherichia phage vB_EcoM_phAPEC6]WPK18592.1 hypothetical protein [Salmonella phage SD-2_S15]WPK19241.1 hypothetical protein [Salmonella phage SD-6_S16]WPK19915.1 hypothetical protein [Salmonella phage SD-1_S14]WPK20934.1 hypothetical protein [Salmonella phage SD-15_S21]SC